MSESPLRAVVVGAGFAGEGHTLALRYAGVDVVAICSRTPAVVQAVAARLGVPEASTDWAETLQRVRPEIVAVATPGSLRAPLIEAAAALGAHIYCDKPLAPDAPEAERLYRLVAASGVKHALAATHRYDPSVQWLAELLRAGTVGELLEVEGTFRRRIDPLTPWGWYDQLASGGGLMHNAFPHWLGILMTTTGGELRRVMGEARVLRHRAPVVPEIHDFRERGARAPAAAEAEALEWRACDADNAFSALLRFAPPGADGPPGREVQVTLVASGARATWPPNGWRFHGESGSLLADGHFGYEVTLKRSADGPAEPLPVPQRLLDDLPAVGTEFQNKWAALARDFVADIRGRPFRPYLTFRDGWRFECTVDTIRAGAGWLVLPE
ncbi:MAG TPA: Gfo/Idh/MocA family oxidoreductase [Chloroflexota bacterium]|nr:Gfo/Idh/MocA family oxidoreductase [Chloroflexota bacterium]